MRHVLIVCSERTGGTWFGKLFDTCSNVKYLWEPDHKQFHPHDPMQSWDTSDGKTVEKAVWSFIPHCRIDPTFEKARVNTAVYKVCAAVNVFQEDWLDTAFNRIRHDLDAKVIHLVRHPVRWAASVDRWSPMDDEKMRDAILRYTTRNLKFRADFWHEDWYRFLRHEDVLENPTHVMDTVFRFSGLARSEAFDRFVREMNSYDGPNDPHKHTVYALKSTALDRWKITYRNWPIVSYANGVVEGNWKGIYERLRG